MELSLTASPWFAQARDRSPEAVLIERSRAGDPDAFAELVRLHQRRVFRMAGRFFRQREDVEDVAQETFLIAWCKLDTYRSAAPFENWLTRVCLRVCYARLKATKPSEPLFEAELATSAASPDAAIEIERLLATLSPEDRFLLLLLEGEGWAVAEIAERLGWTRVKVRVRAHRARKKLRSLLERGTP